MNKVAKYQLADMAGFLVFLIGELPKKSCFLFGVAFAIQSLSYYFMAEGAHRRKNGICKRGINLLPEKDNISSSGRNLSR